MKTQKQIGKEIAAALGKNEPNIIIFLNQIIHGKKKLPNEWITAFLKATECETREDLVKMYPAIIFHDELEIKNDSLLTVRLTIHNPVAEVRFNQLQLVLKALEVLRAYGMDPEILIRTTDTKPNDSPKATNN